MKGGHFGWQISLCPWGSTGDGVGELWHVAEGWVAARWGMLRAGQQCGNVIWGGSGGQGVDLKTLLWWKLGGIGLGSPVLGVLWEPLLASLGSRQSCRLLPGGPCEGRAGGLPAPAGGTVRAQPRAHSAAAALKAAVGRAGPVPGGGDARV